MPGSMPTGPSVRCLLCDACVCVRERVCVCDNSNHHRALHLARGDMTGTAPVWRLLTAPRGCPFPYYNTDIQYSFDLSLERP